MKSASNDRPPRGGATPNWDANDSAQLYGINSWGAGYFNVSDAGEVQVNVDFEGNPVAVSLMEIVRGGAILPAVAPDERLQADDQVLPRDHLGFAGAYLGAVPHAPHADFPGCEVFGHVQLDLGKSVAVGLQHADP